MPEPLTSLSERLLDRLIADGPFYDTDLDGRLLRPLRTRGLAAFGPDGWTATTAGRAYRDQQRNLLDVTVQCSECGETLATASAGSLATIKPHCCTTATLKPVTTPRLQAKPRGTALAAAVSRLHAGKWSDQHQIILDHYAHAGVRGLTQPELEHLPRVDTRAHRTRRRELTEAGYLELAPQKRRLPVVGPSGRRGAYADVYRISDAGLVEWNSA